MEGYKEEKNNQIWAKCREQRDLLVSVTKTSTSIKPCVNQLFKMFGLILLSLL